MPKANGRDLEIVRPYDLTTKFKVMPQNSVLRGVDIIKRGTLKRSEQGSHHCDALASITVLFGSMKKFRQYD